MKFEIHNGDFVGTAEWQAPGEVVLEFDDQSRRAWFETYFSSEDSTLSGPVECASMSSAERRDASAQAFERAMFGLAAHGYRYSPRTPAASTTKPG